MAGSERLAVFSTMSVPKAVLKNALPAMGAMLMALLYNLADTFFIGMTGDALQVAAVSLATPAFLLNIAAAHIFGIGGTSMISRAMGEGRVDYARKVSAFCMWGGLLFGLVMAALFLIFMDPILHLLGTGADTWQATKDYLSIVVLSGPFLIVSNSYSNILRAEGQSLRAMMGVLIGNLLNIVLDPLMILTLGWNTRGAAAATLIGNVVGMSYYMIYFLRGKSMLSIRPREVRLKNGIFSGVMGIGIPACLGSLLMSLSQIVQNGQIAHYNDMAVAGLGVAAKIMMIPGMLCLGLGQGVQPLLGYCVGAKLWPRFKKAMGFSLLFSLAVSGLLTGLCYLFTRGLVQIFLSEPAAFDYGVTFVRIQLTTSCLYGLIFVLVNTLQAMGAAREAFVANLSRQGLIFIPAMFILQALLGINGLVWSQPIADVLSLFLAAALVLLRWRRIRQEKL